uniref:PX domain-containing protein n=1 Tax=Steinernema glaseri TaxID=37863 RepID=A0A1I8AKF1_9BILA
MMSSAEKTAGEPLGVDVTSHPLDFNNISLPESSTTSTAPVDLSPSDQRNMSHSSKDDSIKQRTEDIDLGDNALVIDISDALSERDKVKYTVHTKTTFEKFAKKDVSVVREHEEFKWLHNCLVDTEDYAGFIIPPRPPTPKFDASREKLQKLGEGESTMTKEEFQKSKNELEQEYLATFKKTVAMHEVFLCRLAAHPVLRNDANFRVFLEYEDDLSVRGRNRREQMGSLWKKVAKTADEVLLSGQKDQDEFFEREMNYLTTYHERVRDTTSKSDECTKIRKQVADSYSKIAGLLDRMVRFEQPKGDHEILRNLVKNHELFERLKKSEARVSTDEELKQSDTLRYFTEETQAARDLLYRRTRCLANYESANKSLERARARNRDIAKCETEQQEACKKFEDISKLAKTELEDLKVRRVEAFKKNLVDLAEFEIKQAHTQLQVLQNTLAVLKAKGNSAM